VSLRLVLIEDHQPLREGLELLLDREGCISPPPEPEGTRA
jgi:hypothetical protein